MTITLLSDAHVRGLDDPNQRRLVGFLRACRTDDLVLAGDMVDVWWPARRVVAAACVPLIAALWDLRERGVRVTWVRGNHDFHPGPVIADDLGIAVVDRWIAESGGRRLLAVHGDIADRRPTERVLRRVVRGPVVEAIAAVVGVERVLGIAARASRASRAHGGSSERVVDAQRAWADGRLGRDADVVFVGHSHAPGIGKRERGLLVNLGDWTGHDTYATIEADGIRLMRWDGTSGVCVAGPA